jgi:tRNA-modifying protein YgfZ
MPAESLRVAMLASGAVFARDSVANFGDAAGEYVAASESAALFDVSARAQIEMTGADRAKFLHNFCTNDIKKLQPGEGCEAFIVNVKGRVLGHIFVFAGTESLVIESVPGSQERLRAHLDRYIINEDVQLHDRTASLGELYLCGPRSAAILTTFGIEAERLSLCEHVSGMVGSAKVSVRRVDFTRSPGYLISAPTEGLGDIWSALTAAGAKPAGIEALEALRIEAGMPWYGIDITDDNLAQEVARTTQAISFTKGCYLGQEPIARIDALGHANRELRMLKLSTADVPAPGTKLLSPDGKEIGAVTSSAYSFGEKHAVALGYVRVPHTKPGSRVAIAAAEHGIPAEVFWQ